jgi:hypothetical protein
MFVVSNGEKTLTCGDLNLGVLFSEVEQRELGLELGGKVDIVFVIFLLFKFFVRCCSPVWMNVSHHQFDSSGQQRYHLPASVKVNPWNAGMCVA